MANFNALKLSMLADEHAEGVNRLRSMWLDPKTLFYQDEIPEKSRMDRGVFLAGPTSRDAIPDYMWRKDSRHFLRRGGYCGHIIVPQYRGESNLSEERFFDFDDKPKIVRWEGSGLARVQVRLFWIPRNREQLRGATTNHEVAKWIIKAEHDADVSRSLFIGWPNDAVGMSWLATELEDSKVGHLEGGHYSSQEKMCADIISLLGPDDDIPF